MMWNACFRASLLVARTGLPLRAGWPDQHGDSPRLLGRAPKHPSVVACFGSFAGVLELRPCAPPT